MKRTKYFTLTKPQTDGVTIWRWRDGKMMIHGNGGSWVRSGCFPDNGSRFWIQVTRDEARKKNPTAFRHNA